MKTHGIKPYKAPRKRTGVVLRPKEISESPLEAGTYQGGFWTDYHYCVRLDAPPKLPKGRKATDLQIPIKELIEKVQTAHLEHDVIIGVRDSKIGPLVWFLKTGYVRAAHVDSILSAHPKATPYYRPQQGALSPRHLAAPAAVVFKIGEEIVGMAAAVSDEILAN